jgi:hypothetical protein
VAANTLKPPHSPSIRLRSAPRNPTLRQHRIPRRNADFAGIIDTTTNFVERLEMVAQRTEDVVSAGGDREPVIGSCDCVVGTFAGWEWVTADVGVGEAATMPRRR